MRAALQRSVVHDSGQRVLFRPCAGWLCNDTNTSDGPQPTEAFFLRHIPGRPCTSGRASSFCRERVRSTSRRGRACPWPLPVEAARPLRARLRRARAPPSKMPALAMRPPATSASFGRDWELYADLVSSFFALVPSVFRAEAALAALTSNALVSTRSDAVSLCQMMLRDCVFMELVAPRANPAGDFPHPSATYRMTWSSAAATREHVTLARAPARPGPRPDVPPGVLPVGFDDAISEGSDGGRRGAPDASPEPAAVPRGRARTALAGDLPAPVGTHARALPPPDPGVTPMHGVIHAPVARPRPARAGTAPHGMLLSQPSIERRAALLAVRGGPRNALLDATPAPLPNVDAIRMKLSRAFAHDPARERMQRAHSQVSPDLSADEITPALENDLVPHAEPPVSPSLNAEDDVASPVTAAPPARAHARRRLLSMLGARGLSRRTTTRAPAVAGDAPDDLRHCSIDTENAPGQTNGGRVSSTFSECESGSPSRAASASFRAASLRERLASSIASLRSGRGRFGARFEQMRSDSGDLPDRHEGPRR